MTVKLFECSDDRITVVGGLTDKSGIVGAIRVEDLIPITIQEAIESSNMRFAAIVQGIVDGMKEIGAV